MHPPSFPVPPTIRRTEQELWVVENTRVLLSCAAEGVPQPVLSWEKEGIAVTETGVYTILSSGELELESAQVKKSRHRPEHVKFTRTDRSVILTHFLLLHSLRMLGVTRV